MFSTNNKISVRQLQILLILDIFGMGITLLPRKMAEISGQDGWFAILIGTAIACLYCFLINLSTKQFRDLSFVDRLKKIFSAPVGIFIAIIFVIRTIVKLALEIRLFSEIIKQIILFNTPIALISACMLLLGGYTAYKGYETRARIAEILIFLIFIPLIFVFSIALTDVDFSNLKPILHSNKINLFKSAFISSLSFSAIEYLLISPKYINDRDKKMDRRTIYAVITVGIIFSIITAITIARFGIFDMVHQMWPVLEIMDTIDLTSAFIERQDALIMSFWIIAIFIIINAGLFFSSVVSQNIIKKGKHNHYLILFVIIVYVLSFIPKNIAEVYYYIEKTTLYFDTAYLLVVPVLMLIISKVRHLEVDSIEKN